MIILLIFNILFIHTEIDTHFVAKYRCVSVPISLTYYVHCKY